MRALIHATSEGNAPAIMVTTANRIDSFLLVAHTSSSARLLYRKTPKKRRGELGASGVNAGDLAIPGFADMQIRSVVETAAPHLALTGYGDRCLVPGQAASDFSFSS